MMSHGRPTNLWQRLHINLPLLLGLLSLLGVSLVVLYSASGMHAEMLVRQVIRTGLAFAVMLGLAQLSPSFYARWAPPVFVLGVVLLICVLAFGHIGKGAQRWLDLGVIKFQPSEILKLVMPMTIAAYLSRQPLPPASSRWSSPWSWCCYPPCSSPSSRIWAPPFWWRSLASSSSSWGASAGP